MPKVGDLVSFDYYSLRDVHTVTGPVIALHRNREDFVTSLDVDVTSSGAGICRVPLEKVLKIEEHSHVCVLPVNHAGTYCECFCGSIRRGSIEELAANPWPSRFVPPGLSESP